MKTQIIALCLAATFAAGAQAQDLATATTTTTAPDHGDVKCLMKSNAATWQTLGLTAEKTKQAQAIVENCSKKHASMTEDERKKMDVSTATESHVLELKNLLTPDEFKRWQEWCGKQGYEMEKAAPDKSKQY